MRKKTFFFSVFIFCCFGLIPATASWGSNTSPGPFLALPTEQKYDAKIARLGQKLFQDVRLSKDNQLSCNSCHINQLNGIDSRPKSIGPDNQIGHFNTPSLYNATLLSKLFWAGKESNIHQAIHTHIQDSTIMAGKWPDILAALSHDITLSTEFKNSFTSGITDHNIVTALVHYLNAFNYTPSRFDAYLKGNVTAISPEEKIGLKQFMSLGCHLCHQGKLIGGNLTMPLGVIYPYPDNPNNKNFRVPSLRNVTKTAPYFHDGSISTLEEAIKIMAKYQTGNDLKDSEINSIVLFLKTLESTLIKGPDHAP